MKKMKKIKIKNCESCPYSRNRKCLLSNEYIRRSDEFVLDENGEALTLKIADWCELEDY